MDDPTTKAYPGEPIDPTVELEPQPTGETGVNKIVPLGANKPEEKPLNMPGEEDLFDGGPTGPATTSEGNEPDKEKPKKEASAENQEKSDLQKEVDKYLARIVPQRGDPVLLAKAIVDAAKEDQKHQLILDLYAFLASSSNKISATNPEIIDALVNNDNFANNFFTTDKVILRKLGQGVTNKVKPNQEKPNQEETEGEGVGASV